MYPDTSRVKLSRKSVTILGRRSISEPSTPHIGKEVALVARTAAFVYIYARIPQRAEMPLSFYATELKLLLTVILRMADKSNVSTLSITGLEHEDVELMKH